MKKGLLKRLSAIALAAVLAVGLVPVAGNITNGAVGAVEANAAEIHVTSETIWNLKQKVAQFKTGNMTGEALYTEVSALIDDEGIAAELNAAYEPYMTSKSLLKESLYEYCDYIEQTADYYDLVLQQQRFTSCIKLIKSLTRQVTLSVSVTDVEIYVSVEELRAYGNRLYALTDGLEQGHPVEELKAAFEENISWFEPDEIHTVIEERFTQYIADRDTYARVLQEILDWLCYELQMAENGDAALPIIVTEDPVDYGLDIPRRSVVTDPESGESTGTTTWDCVWFGAYPQKSSWSDGTDPIKWRVLWVDGDDAFLLADKNLDMMQYHHSDGDSTGDTTINWSTCTLRTWLNEDFYNTAFNEEEQHAIKTTIVTNENNPEWGTYGGGTTFDKVYLLSVSEAMNPNYGFPNTNDKLRDELKVTNTAYTDSKNYSSPTGKIDFWWLRTIGYASGYAVRARNSGGIIMKGYYTWSIGLAVRPCLHIDLSNDVWTYAGTVCSDGTVQEPAFSHTHVWNDGYTVDKPATCLEEGSESIHCAVCGEIKEGTSRAIAKTDHAYGEWQITVEPTYTETGIREKFCTICGGKISEAIPKLVKKGWQKEDDSWYFYNDDGTKVVNTWKKDSKGWCYLGSDGKMVTNGWAKDSKGWCWMGPDGYWVTNKWIQDKGEWYYIKSNGYMAANEWAKDRGGWMWLDASGKITKNKWIQTGGYWYYLKSNGYMAANEWAKDSGGWMYMDANGRITKSKWVKSGGYWYYLKSNGYMATGTQKIGGKTYKFDSAGRWI